MNNISGHTPLFVKIGVLLAVITILFGFVVGVIFGENEDGLREMLKTDGERVLDVAYHGDTDAMNRTVSRSLTYFKRAHIHGSGLGAAAVVLITVMMLFSPPGKLRDISALLIGMGAFGYSTFWLIAGRIAPGLGGIDKARDAVILYARLTALLCLAGIVLTLIVFVRSLFLKRQI